MLILSGSSGWCLFAAVAQLLQVPMKKQNRFHLLPVTITGVDQFNKNI